MELSDIILENGLGLGIVPDSLNFCLSNDSLLNDAKIKYNKYYLTPEFIVSKFPKQFLETEFLFPVISHTIQKIQEQNLTPLEQLEIKSKDIYNGKYTNLH